jgi:epsilon-lactone hydrolase
MVHPAPTVSHRETLGFYLAMARATARAAALRAQRGPEHPAWPWSYELAMEALRVAVRDHYHVAVRVVRASASPVFPDLALRVRSERSRLADIAVESFAPRSVRAGAPTILYLHGGGYVTCSPASHRHVLARLAIVTGARCVAPDYRLAPEHPFPAALDDALACYRALTRESSGPLVVAGDSAGGGLCVSLMLKLRELGEPLPRAAVLLSPWVDLTLDHHTPGAAQARDYLVAGPMGVDGRRYAGAAGPSHPLVSPVYADLTGLPAMLVQTGGWELLHDQNVRFVERAREAGVHVVHEVEPGLLHGYACFPGVLPQARSAFASIARFVREHAFGVHGASLRASGADPRGSVPAEAP